MSVENPVLETAEQRVSYGFGWQFGRQLQRNRFDGLDIEAVVAAVRRCYAGEPCPLSDEQLNQAYAGVNEKRHAQERQRQEKMRELSEQFLVMNAQRDEVQTTASGLQYEILEEGAGEKPGRDSVVRVHYHGSFVDGQVFDSSVTRNEPAEFGVTQVIAGWTEALQMMPVGSKWRLAIPPQLGYGEMGSPPVIPGNAALVFEVQLLDIVS